MVDSPALHSAAWISALIGALMSLPVMLCFELLRNHQEGTSGTMLRIALLVFNAAGAANVLRNIVRSAGFLTLDRTPSAALLLPVALVMMLSLMKNGDTIGYSAAVWLRIFPILLLIVFVMQLPYYRVEWLCPVLGSGWKVIIEQGVRTAGWFTAIAGIRFAAVEASGKTRLHRTMPMICLTGTGIAVLLIALRVMMTPGICPGGRNSWLVRMDSLLSNGRAPLYLQMPMIVMWYAGHLHLLSCMSFTAAALLQQVFPNLDGRLCVALTTAVSALFSTADILTGYIDPVFQWQFISLTLLAGFNAARLGGKACAKNG